ncbi:hypothetical protein [Izhakiella capsodis]|nr:hypothetical protein [Izhakiella capsodis]
MIISERSVHLSSLDNILHALILIIVQLNESQQDEAVTLATIL